MKALLMSPLVRRLERAPGGAGSASCGIILPARVVNRSIRLAGTVARHALGMAQLRCLNVGRCLASAPREKAGTHMRSLLAFAIAAALAGPAYAQMPPLGIPMGTPEKERPVDPIKENEYRPAIVLLDRK